MQVRFGLFPFHSPLPQGISVDFSSSPYLDVSVRGVTTPIRSAAVLPAAGSPIRASPDRRLRAPTRSLSQLATPFISAQAKPSIRWRIMPSLLRNPHRFCVEGLCMVVTVSLGSPLNPSPPKSLEAASTVVLSLSLCPSTQIMAFLRR
jgi:hypothetical protein